MNKFLAALILITSPAAYAQNLSKPDVTTTDGIYKVLERSVIGIWRDLVEHLPFIVTAFIILFITWLLAWVVSSVVGRIAKQAKLRGSLRDLVMRMARVGVWTIGLLMAAMILFPGLTPTKALGGLGLMSVAIGLAFQDIFENFFAGVLLLWKFPFENGDFITCGDVSGQVENVFIRNTTIRTVTGELIVVPNAFLFKNPVYVLTDRTERRADIVAGIAYSENADHAVDVIADEMRLLQTVNQDRPIQVFVKSFGASSIDIEVAWWTDATPVGQRASRNEVVAAIKRRLDKEGIEIPFPYRTLTFKEPLTIANQKDSTGL